MGDKSHKNIALVFLKSVLLVSLLPLTALAQQWCAAASSIDSVPSFIGESYADILNRAPDSSGQVFYIAELEGLNSTSCSSQNPALSAGTCEWVNNSQITLDFLSSAESIAKNGNLTDNSSFVTQLYQLLLHRSPDSTGFNLHVSQLESGTTRLSVVDSFLSSPEYRHRFPCTFNGTTNPVCNGSESIDSIPSFIPQSYLDILDRLPDDQGQVWWTQYTTGNQLAMCRNSSSSAYSACDRVQQAQTSLNLFNSEEYQQSNPPIDQSVDFVTALYEHLLQRSPDPAGLQWYTQYVNSTNDRIGTIEAFLSSNEYRQRFSCYIGNLPQLSFGVNGHPFNAAAYSNTDGVNFNTQMSLIQSAFLGWYRVDIGVTSGNNDFSDMDLLLNIAQAAGIQLLPDIMPAVNRETDTLDQLYGESYSAAFNIVSRYKSSIHIWELSNEEDVQSLYEKGDPWGNTTWPYGAPPGDSLTDYNPVRLAKSEAILNGLANGARDADPSCVRIINFAWIHTGFIQHLENDATPYDVVGMHWYSNADSEVNTGMGDITCPGQDLPCTTPLLHFNVVQRLNTVTNGKPLWITETNYQPLAGNSVSTDLTWEENYLPPALQLYLNAPVTYPFQVVFVYELLDEPALANSGPAFSEMGLYQDTLNPDGSTTLGPPKPAYLSVQQLLGTN